MYIDSAPGSLGFPSHITGGSWRSHLASGGPGAEMTVGQNAASDVEIMGSPASDYVQLMAAPAPSEGGHMPLIIGALCVLGLGFVIYKATR